MERLTQWMGEHAAVVSHHENYIDRLAYYEDLEEQGKLVVLPCSVGDTFYTAACICSCRPDYYGCDEYEKCEECPYAIYDIREWKFKSAIHILNSIPYFGKTIFFSEEEAKRVKSKHETVG